MSLALGAQRPATPRSGRSRRVVAAVAGLVLVAASLVAGAAPAGASTPSAPRLFAAVGYQTHIRLWFTAPTNDGGSPITKYTITRRTDPFQTQEAPDTFTVTDAHMWTDPSSFTGSQYRYTITATNGDGTSAPSEGITVRQVPDLTDFSKFTSVTAFVNRQFQDFLGRPPTSLELSQLKGLLNKGTLTAPAFFDQLMSDPSRTIRQQVTRLYLAYFKRGPDHGGLAYWARELKNGTKGLDDVSNSFARSNEFKTTYGSLSNVDFVSLVYRNVLGRDAEATGLAFWTNQLDQRLAIRGRVMTEFSESNEFLNTSKGRAQAAELWDTMLGSNIPPATLDLYAGYITGGGTAGDLATLILSLDRYVVE